MTAKDLEPWIPVILALALPILTGIGFWFKQHLEANVRREQREQNEKLTLLAKIESLQKTISDMYQERLADEANKRREADTSVKMIAEAVVLMKQLAASAAVLSSKGPTQ